MASLTPQSFEVPAPAPAAGIILIALAVLLPLGLAGLTVMNHQPVRDVLPALIASPILLMLAALWLRRRSITLQDGVLEIRAAMYRKRIPIGEMDLAAARSVNLEEHTELRPWMKTNAMSLPGFSAGHYRMREKLGKAFCLLTDPRRVLLLPLRDGSRLLLSLERPQALLEALRTQALEG